LSLQRTPRPVFGPKTFIGRCIAVVFFLLFLSGVLTTGWSLANAVFTPINDPVSAKIAEWARGHGMGGIVTGLESLQYTLNPPKVGGAPLSGLLKGEKHSANSRALGAFALQNSLPTIVTPALTGEGEFKVVVKSHGMPLVQVAYLRPDTLHTSYLSAIVWMSGQHTRLEQHPGQTDPGHLALWSKASSINDSAASGLMAAFNGGFKIKDSRGGYYQNGHTVGVLTNGAASLVVYRNGKTEIGVWGSQLRLTRAVVSVRQNLQLLIDNGQLAQNLDAAVHANWGTTVGASINVWRSGLGITAQGDLLYVAGEALSAHSLATLLLNAGAVRAMQLDINKAWISYMWFKPTSTGKLAPHKVLNFQRPASRYFSPTSRDFFAVYYR
jgi:hypothetical protein